MIQNMYFKPKVLSEAEQIYPERYKDKKHMKKRDVLIYQKSVERKDVSGKKISDIRHNIYGSGIVDTIKRKSNEKEPDLLKTLFFKNSMNISKMEKICNI